MATRASILLEVERLLYGMVGAERPKEDTLNGAITSGATSLTPTTTALWKRDNYAEFIDTSGASDEIVIFAADSSGATTVRRGQLGTTAAAQSSGDVMRKNPTYPRITIEDAIDDVVDNELWPDVWFWSDRTLTFTAGDHLYDLAAADEEVLEMYQFNLNSDNGFHPFPGPWYSVKTQVHTDVASTGKVLLVRRVYDTAETVHYVAYTRPQSSAISSLPDTVANIIPWGAVAKLLTGKISQRHIDPLRDRAITEQDPTRDWRFFQAEFERMKQDEKVRLRKEESARRQRRFVPRIPRRWA